MKITKSRENIIESKSESSNKNKAKKQIKLAFVDGADGSFLEKFQILFGDSFDFILDEENPDIVFYSVFSYRHINYDCIRIFMCAENCHADYNFCDYSINYDNLNFGKRHLRYAFWADGDIETLSAKNNFDESYFNRKFCSFVVTNGGADRIRKDCFYKLSAYKKVDSGGRWLNNIGGAVENKNEFLRQYKFNICFENCFSDGYITEKIFDAKISNTIPIYWGGGAMMEFNKKAFINASDFDNLDSMIEFVRFLDNDKNAYLAMLNEPLLLDSNIGKIYHQKLKNFFAPIFENLAYAREFGQWRMNLENRYKKSVKARVAIIKLTQILRLEFMRNLFKK